MFFYLLPVVTGYLSRLRRTGTIDACIGEISTYFFLSPPCRSCVSLGLKKKEIGPFTIHDTHTILLHLLHHCILTGKRGISYKSKDERHRIWLAIVVVVWMQSEVFAITSAIDLKIVRRVSGAPRRVPSNRDFHLLARCCSVSD